MIEGNDHLARTMHPIRDRGEKVLEINCVIFGVMEEIRSKRNLKLLEAFLEAGSVFGIGLEGMHKELLKDNDVPCWKRESICMELFYQNVIGLSAPNHEQIETWELVNDLVEDLTAGIGLGKKRIADLYELHCLLIE